MWICLLYDFSPCVLFDLCALGASFFSKTVLFTNIFRLDSVLAFLLFMSIFSMQGLCTDELFQRACIFASCWQYMDRCLSSKYDVFSSFITLFKYNPQCWMYCSFLASTYSGPFFLIIYYDMSQCMRFPTMWYVRPTKHQISLRIRTVWSEPLLVAWIFYHC